jgi:hypothetical protein
MEMLVEVSTPDFVAYVTNFNDLPSSKVLPLIAEKDVAVQFMGISELLYQSVAPEVVDALKELPITQLADFVSEWLKVSYDAK